MTPFTFIKLKDFDGSACRKLTCFLSTPCLHFRKPPPSPQTQPSAPLEILGQEESRGHSPAKNMCTFKKHDSLKPFSQTTYTRLVGVSVCEIHSQPFLLLLYFFLLSVADSVRFFCPSISNSCSCFIRRTLELCSWHLTTQSAKVPIPPSTPTALPKQRIPARWQTGAPKQPGVKATKLEEEEFPMLHFLMEWMEQWPFPERTGDKRRNIGN